MSFTACSLDIDPISDATEITEGTSSQVGNSPTLKTDRLRSTSVQTSITCCVTVRNTGRSTKAHRRLSFRQRIRRYYGRGGRAF